MTTVRLFDLRCRVGIGRMSLQFFGDLAILLDFVFVFMETLKLSSHLLWRCLSHCKKLLLGFYIFEFPKDELVQIGDPINGNRDFLSLTIFMLHAWCYQPWLAITRICK